MAALGPLVWLCLSAAPAAPAAPKEQRIAVLEMVVEGGADPVIGRQLTNRLAEALAARPHTKVIAPDDVRAMLEKEAQKQLLGCGDDRCLAEIGGALGADVLVQGRVSKIDAGYAVALALVDAVKADSLGRVTETWQGEPLGLLELVGPMIERAFDPKGTHLGAIVVEGPPDGATIYVDDQLRGTAPAGQMGQVPTGARRVRVAAEGYEPFERWIVVQSGQVAAVPVQLTPTPSAPVYATWWFWTGAAVIVAGAAVGGVLLLGSGDESGGATGVNVSLNAERVFTEGR